MAAADYYLCDICDNKTFYDAELNWQEGTKENNWEDWLYGVGDMKVICTECSKKYEIIIREK